MTKAIEAAAEAFAKESWGAVWWAERSEAERQAEIRFEDDEAFPPTILVGAFYEAHRARALSKGTTDV